MNLELLIAETICGAACEAYAETEPLLGKLMVRGCRVLAQNAGLPRSFCEEIWAWERLILENRRRPPWWPPKSDVCFEPTATKSPARHTLGIGVKRCSD